MPPTTKFAKLAKTAGLALLAWSVSLAGAASTEKQSGHSSATAQKASHHPIRHKKTHRTKLRGQKAIDADRAREIQEALIREHYLKGQPTGKWDDATQAAMKRYQSDQGWQNRTVPDARALIRLGLGPDTGHLLNPESAMTTAPAMAHATAAASSGSATKGASSQSPSMPQISSMPVGSAPPSSSPSTSSPISAEPAR